MSASASVVAVHCSGEHHFSKPTVPAITLVAGIGVIGDAHAGAQVKHRSRVAADPTQPNLRQVHLIHRELLDDLATAGFDVKPGELGENISTAGIDLLGLPTGAVLRLGDDVILAVTGLRNPCGQIDGFQEGLRRQVLLRHDNGTIERRAGIMAVVVHGGVVRPGDPIAAAVPPGPAVPLARV